MLKQTAILAALLSTLITPGSKSVAQQLDAAVVVNYETVGASNKDLLQDLEADIRAYLNDYTWGTDNPSVKTECTFDIRLQGVVGENRYSAQIFVGSKRKLFGSGKNSVVLRIFDESWEFTYVRNRPINHNTYALNDLASVLDFYAYVVIGYDYDSYEKLSGKRYFQRAADVANLGRSSSQKGWVSAKSGYSRVQFADELNDSKFSPLHVASYVYHYEGLDSLAIRDSLTHAPTKAWKNILRALDMIAKAKKYADPRNIMIRSFFESKYSEIADVFLDYPDKGVYLKFSTIDPSHQQTYEEYRTKRRDG